MIRSSQRRVCVDGMREWYQSMSEVDGKRSAFQYVADPLPIALRTR